MQTSTSNPHMLWLKVNDKELWLDSIRRALVYYHSSRNKLPSYLGMNRKDIIALGRLSTGDYLRGVKFMDTEIRVVPIKTCLSLHLQLYY